MPDKAHIYEHVTCIQQVGQSKNKICWGGNNKANGPATFWGFALYSYRKLHIDIACQTRLDFT